MAIMLGTIEVTADDIAQGERQSCYRCPVALAALRLPLIGHVHVDRDSMVVTLAGTLIDRRYYLPGSVQLWISQFDRGFVVYPMAFHPTLRRV